MQGATAVGVIPTGTVVAGAGAALGVPSAVSDGAAGAMAPPAALSFPFNDGAGSRGSGGRQAVGSGRGGGGGARGSGDGDGGTDDAWDDALEADESVRGEPAASSSSA